MKTIYLFVKTLIAVSFFYFLQSCYSAEKFPAKDITQKIPVLNLGTFHMGFSSDATTVNYDENDPKNILENKEIARKIAAFKPTIIIVETEPQHNEALQKSYFAYCKNPNMKFENPSEIELLAYEVGRISGAKKIYGVDHQLGYNYMKIAKISEQIKAETYLKFMNEDAFPDNPKHNTLEALIYNNQPQYLDYLMNINADMMMHVSTDGNYEGADEAAKFYKRNMRMYSNLNRIELQENDRVFILMGATHTAFFNEFMKRSTRYSLVNVFDYLK